MCQVIKSKRTYSGKLMNARVYMMELGRIIKSAIFQTTCKICENFLVFREESILCNDCFNDVEPINDNICKLCGKIIGRGPEMCGECIIDPPPFDRHISYSSYTGTVKEMILLFKYHEINKLKKTVAGYYYELFKRRIISKNENFDFIVPVPNDRSRKREFNSIHEISRILSKKLGIRMLTGNLIKVKKTPPQVGLSLENRKKNLDDAFELKNPSEVRNKKILLIDDVYTTGTTIKKCSEPLKKEGARVFVMTLARSV